MPRQLPWKSGGGGSRTQTRNPPARPSRTTRLPDGFDGDLFDNTVLASNSIKGKGKAEITRDSDDELPQLPNEASTPNTKRAKTTISRERPTSSSPPALTDYLLPQSEPMRKGVSKFDLRDDEWMMVEDEFLETAKLFTRHLHIAEYDRLKETIEAKKKEAEIARPVVAGAKRSVEGIMKEKAKAQESKQKKAIRDVFTSQADSSEDDKSLYHRRSSKTTSKPQPSFNAAQEIDSDDLDAPRAKSAAHALETAPKVQSKPSQISRPVTSSFARPTLPAVVAKPPNPRVSASRMTPFDMLDEYKLPTYDNHRSQETIRNNKPRSHSTSSNLTPAQSLRSSDPVEDWGSTNHSSTLSKEVAVRLAKRKAERAKESGGKEKKRATQLDDIPTFLF